MGVMDRYNEKKKKKQDSSNNSTAARGVMDRYEEHKFFQSLPTDSVNEEFVNSFVSDANNFFSSFEDGKTSLSFSDATATLQDLETRGDTIRGWLYKNKNNLDEKTYNSISDTFGKFKSGFEGIKNYYSQWDSEDSYNQWYKAESEKQAILGAEDFEQYRQAGTEISNPTWDNAFAPVNIFGWTPMGEGEKVNNIVTFAEENAETILKDSSPNRGGEDLTSKIPLMNLINLYATDEEKSIYNYYIGKGEVDKANEYLTNLHETLKQRQAGFWVEQADGTAFELLFSAVAGFEQFGLGIKNLDNFIMGTEGESTTSLQYAQSAMSGNNEGVWKVANDFTTTTTNMLPSIAVGYFTGGLGGTLTMGASVLGNSYAEMRSLGYDEWQSRGYATLVSASEMALQYFLGGIGKLGGKVSGKAISNFASKYNNALARTAITLGGKMASEGIEEALQTALEPAFKALVTGEDFEAAEWEDIFYSGLLGALSAGAFEGVPTIAGEVAYDANLKQHGQSLIDQGSVDTLQQLAFEMSGATANSDIGRLSSKVSSKASARNVGNLSVAIGDTINAQNLSDIQTALVEKGLSKKDAKRVAEYLVGNTETLTDKQKAKIEAEIEGNENIKAVISELLENPESAVNERGRNLSRARLGITSQETTEQGEKALLTENASSETNVQNEAYTVSGSGKTTQISTGEEISIKEIASIKDGKVTLRLDNGETVEASDVEFSSDAERLLYENVVRMGLNAETANAFIRGFDASEGLSTGEYSLGFREAYRYGYYSFPIQEMSTEGFSAKLSEAKKNLAYNLGKTDAKYNVSEKQKAKTEGIVRTSADNNASSTKKYRKYKGETHIAEIDKEGFLDTLTESQQNDVKAMVALHEALGINVYFFESPTDENGKRLGKNGYYNPKDGSIHIDLFAGTSGKNTILFTAAHELTHFIREWSPAKFKVFADFLLKNYGEKGISVDTLVRNQIEKARKNGRSINYDEAYEEVVADSCESMLADGDAISKIAELKAKDKSLWQKIKDFITNLVKKIKSYYQGLQPDSVEGRYVAEMLDTVEQLKTLWTEALVDAGETYSATEAKEGKAVTKNEGQELYSLRGTNKDGIEVYETSDEIKKLPIKERQKAFLDIMQNQYQGRTAKFVRNGHAYYATFEEADVNKNIYGDKKSDHKGWKAKINVGAEGDIFELVENAKYRGSKAEMGKKISAHKGVGYWDYFIKLVQIDNVVFDLIANVRKKSDGQFVYSIQLNENKKIEASPSLGLLLKASNRMLNASDDSIAQSPNSVKSKFSDRDNFDWNSERGQLIATAMDMATCKQMIERVYRIVNPNQYEEKPIYRNAEEWLADVGADEVALYIESEYILQEKYLDKIPAYLDGDVYVSEIIEAYQAGVLKGTNNKKEAVRLDTTKGSDYRDTRFYAPKKIEGVKALYEIANQKLTNANRQEVTNARAKILLFAHNRGAVEELGITQSELNKKLRSWSNYSAKARDISQKINNGVALSNKWTGIENSSYLYNATISEEDFASLVGDISGSSSEYERRYIASTMLALDTHIDYTGIKFKFGENNFIRGSVLGQYHDDTRTIRIRRGSGLNTVAHEMGHAIDHQWTRDVWKWAGRESEGYTSGLSDGRVNLSLLTDQEVIQWINNFKVFVDNISDSSDIHNDYTQSKNEVFARFVAWFTEQTMQIATGRTQNLGYYTASRADKFTYNQYIEFVKVLQEKAKLDSKYQNSGEDTVKFSLRDTVEEDVTKHYGKTYRWSETGYILKDGTRLDLSGRNEGASGGYRSVDHRDIFDIYEDGDVYGTDAMIEFIARGNIRVMPESPGINLQVEPTTEQYRLIQDLVERLGWKEEYFSVDFDDANGDTIDNLTYEGRVSARKVVADIKHYFKEGSVPHQSELSKFRYSDRDSLGNELSAEQQDFFKDSKARDNKGNLLVLYHGTSSKFTTFKQGVADGWGKGIYFTDNRAEAKNYGNNIVKAYLNITNPYIEAEMSYDDIGAEKTKAYKDFIKKHPSADMETIYTEYVDVFNSILRELGYDGIIGDGSNGIDGLEVVAFNESQPKLTTNRNPKRGNDIRYSERESYAPTFYSYMGKVVDGIKSEKVGAGGVVSYLKGKGVKNEEIKWSGIETWLEGKKSVTKKELQVFIAGSQLQIQEQMSGHATFIADDGNTYESESAFKDAAYAIADKNGIDRDRVKFTIDTEYDMDAYAYVGNMNNTLLTAEVADAEGMSPRWSQYKLDGGENYRELVFVMPNSSYSNRAMRVHWGEEAEGVLAHARIQDITTTEGKKMLFIEEIQSDWHNEGSKKGYKNEALIEKIGRELDSFLAKKVTEKFGAEAWKAFMGGTLYQTNETLFFDVERHIIKAHDEWSEKNPTKSKQLNEDFTNHIPDAPFRNNYHEYVLKRLLRMASEEGYDSIGWTPADIQSDRWSDDYAEGYRIEYDQDIPSFLKKYGKKWGATVGTEKTTEGYDVWSMDITDSMKDSVLYEGQVLYSDRDDLNQLKTDLKSKYQIDPNNVIALADSYMENYGGTLNKTQFRIQFLSVAEALAEASTTGNTDTLMRADEELGELAKEIANEPKATGGVATEIKAIRKHLKGVRIQIPKYNKGDFEKQGGFENFRKRHIGSLLLAKDGINVDALYPELQELFGTGYFPADITNIADQLIKIAEVVDTPLSSVSEVNYDVDEAKEYIVSDLSEKIINIITHQDSGLYINDRNTEGMSNRSLLANALEGATRNDIERKRLKEYKGKIELIESEQAKLSQLRAEIKELSFAKGRRDTAKIRSLQDDATRIANRINTYDRQLLNLESTTALKGVLEREKQMAYKRAEQRGKEALERYREKAAKTQRELLTRYQESRKKAVEGRNKTEMRHKIKNVVSDLNKLLLNPTKEQHVPIGLQGVVADALDAINMDTMNAEERVAYYNDLISKSSNPDEIAILTKKRDFFEYRDANFKERITALKNAYAEFKESDDPLIRNAHNDAIEDLIKNTADFVGNKSLKDMSLEQLEAVYDMYKAILATVRNANKMFKEGRQATVTENSESVKTQVAKVGGHRDRVLKITKWLKQQGWNMLKPVTAMKVIGSDTFAKLFDNVRAGEDTWAVDVNEAKEFYQDKSKKYNYKSWDFKKRYNFKDSTGNSFSLSLEQIMSLYAYSKRTQADKHLEFGGFIFDDAIEVVEKKLLGIPLKYEVNDANPYRIDAIIMSEIASTLTEEQRAFVDEMQAYLSDVMGEKGNEISLAMYDIKLYKEKNYFPLKTSRYFREFDSEKSATPKIKNSGFSKKTVPQAGNPIVLSNFMDVWASHVNDMSMYHAFVLPLEDFMRVYNYSSTAGGYDSVQQYIKNAYGSQANQYIEKLMEDLNGGARVDSSAGIINKGLSLFKKASVFASASVVIQQPSAIARAFAYINPKYFVTSAASAINFAKHKTVWAEVKKYAPVAVIKEMGRFDTGMGKSTVEWIKGNQSIKDKIDDALSKAPAMADELAWTYIWEAVKKEIKATTELKVDSEEFLKKVGERFTEVIVNTQVYDSVLSRSGMMRSKDTGMKMATAFMAEPTTTLNMMVDGIIQGKRGNKKFTASTVGAVSASIILNAILVSFVYAARDDDEDETYTEKYIGSLTSELLDGFNPLTYIPFVKDIWSVAQGYNVERSDMSVVSNLWESIEGLFNEDKSGWEKVLDVAGSVSSVCGIPLKNIIRDAKGMYNLYETLFSGTRTTKAGIGESIEDSVKNSVPLWGRLSGSKTNSDRLYEAIISGDQEQIKRVKGRFKDESAIKSAMRQGLRDNDPRIKEAAQARIDGDIAEYTRIAKEIIAEGNFSQDIIVGAINAEINAINKGTNTESSTSSDTNKVTSIYKMEDYFDALVGRDEATAYAVKEDIIKTDVANGKDREEAETSFNKSFTDFVGDEYKEGNLSDYEAIDMLIKYGEKSEEDANSKVQYWAFTQEYPDYDLSESAVNKYYEYAEPSGINAELYYNYYKEKSKCTGTDSNGDGRADNGTKKAEIMAVINSLPITYEQKDALYYLNGWSAKTIYEAPWH